ncbi:MAG TPA: alpha/beta hydrolase [Pirellulales bacterium]|nr:alpha/beta hydrolase [Pirellulales bacterium]
MIPLCICFSPRKATSAIFTFTCLLLASVAFAAEPAAGVKSELNIPYVENGHQRQVLDLYVPDESAQKPWPLVIWIHGGAWLAGSRAHPPVMYLTHNGFALASIDYRFSQDAVWPAQIFDCKAAVRFLRANAAKYHLDPDHFGVGGDSAGGHLAAMLGASGDVQELEGDLGNSGVSSRVQAVLDWFGPTDISQIVHQSSPKALLKHDGPNSPEARLLGGPIEDKAELARTANPITYISPSDPPFLIMHGDADRIVPHAQSVILAKALIDAGVQETFKTLPGADHEAPQFHSPENQRLIVDFFSQQLKPTPEPSQ